MEVDNSEVRVIRLEDVLAQLPDTLAYSMLAGLPLREHWHVKMQLMQEDRDEYLVGDSDVVKGSYEGGLKTWECSVDLAEFLSTQLFPEQFSVLEVRPLRLEAQQGVARMWFCPPNGNDVFKSPKGPAAMDLCSARLQQHIQPRHSPQPLSNMVHHAPPRARRNDRHRHPETTIPLNPQGNRDRI